VELQHWNDALGIVENESMSADSKIRSCAHSTAENESGSEKLNNGNRDLGKVKNMFESANLKIGPDVPSNAENESGSAK
jgi:hypothetical protein